LLRAADDNGLWIVTEEESCLLLHAMRNSVSVQLVSQFKVTLLIMLVRIYISPNYLGNVTSPASSRLRAFPLRPLRRNFIASMSTAVNGIESKCSRCDGERLLSVCSFTLHLGCWTQKAWLGSSRRKGQRAALPSLRANTPALFRVPCLCISARLSALPTTVLYRGVLFNTR
jgi:hypothetical protein